MSFDINDRNTWDWIDGGMPKSPAHGDYALNPFERTSFYQYSHGTAYLHQCPLQDDSGTRLVFNPMLGVCVWPNDVSEADIYAWAVDQGLVNGER